jgi:hypothetical protein
MGLSLFIITLGQLVRDTLVTIDTGHISIQRVRMSVSRVFALFIEIHELKAVAIAAFT